MSVYERYESTSRHYDSTRVPIGVEVILGALATCGKPLAEVALLDAGCGTGAYSGAVIDRVGCIAGIDLNPGMLKKARARLAAHERRGRIELHQGNLEAMPFADARFDAAMINQVLHHLETGEDRAFPVHRRVLAEIHRVLRPGGVLVINTCSDRQLAEGFWYYDLIPEAARAARRRAIALADLRAMLVDLGFSVRGRIVPLDEVMQGDAYFDPLGPLDPAWRAGDSIWAQATPDEIEAAEARVRALAAAGEIEAYVSRHDAARATVGQFTFLVAGRP